MSELVERAAMAMRAIVLPDGADPRKDWEAIGDGARRMYRRDAMAAIGALRDPDNLVLKAGCVALDKPDAQSALMEAELRPNVNRRIEMARVKMRFRWNAMINAALSLPSEQSGGK